MAELWDQGKLKAWLEDKEPQVAFAIATRAALRSLPYLSSLSESYLEEWQYQADLKSLLRCSLTSYVAAKRPTHHVQLVAGAAASAAVNAAADAGAVGYAAADAIAYSAKASNADSAAFAAAYSSVAGYAASKSDAAFWAATGNDVAWFEASFGDSAWAEVALILERPVWPTGTPNFMDEPRRVFLDYLRGNPSLCFWAEWYERAAAGRPNNWGLQQKVAFIPNRVWDAGVQAVAEAIAEIEAKHLVKATPYAERIEVNPETGKLRSTPSTLNNENLYQVALNKVRDALDDLKDEGTLPQHCNALEPIDRKLTRTLERYSENSQRVHDDFLSAAKEVDRLLEIGEVANEPEVQALRTDLITGSDDIRAADAEVRASVEARVKLRIEEMRVADTELAADILFQVAEVSEGPLQESLEEDVATLRAIRYIANSGAPDVGPADRSETVDAIYRGASRTSKIAEGWNVLKRAAEGYDTGLKIAGMSGGIITLVRWFLQLLG